MNDGRKLKDALQSTWGAFFRRYGNFTLAQLAALPLLLAGENVLLCAPTAGGKTEAALAPLIERYLPAEARDPAAFDHSFGRSPTEPRRSVTILYILPTRALISDMMERLRAPLDVLRISCAVKTHDATTFKPEQPADILLTTPESLDALLANHARSLAGVRAVVLDELHTFDATVRGDQLRVLLNRLRQVRLYAARTGDAPDGELQFAALSATILNPDVVAGRYFGSARIVSTEQANPGAREILAEEIALEEGSVGALLDYLGTFRARGWRKALAFCNSRADVERYAAAVRTAGSPFGDAVYVHYSNLERERRREIEHAFAHAEAAICFASSTLELGIDIGNIDVTLLIGPPGSKAAFVQRAGRANRREKVTRVACFSRTPLERIMFGALLDGGEQSAGSLSEKAEGGEEAEEILVVGENLAPNFLPSVAIQQIFSLLKQSTTGAVRLNPLVDLFSGLLSAADLLAILGTLQELGYLKVGRAGEWRAGERLNHLVDMQGAAEVGRRASTLSLNSNLETGGALLKIRDSHSQRVVANVDRQWFDSGIVTLEGRPLNIEWYDRESLWVSAYPDKQTRREEDVASTPGLRYFSTRQTLSYDLARRFPLQFRLPLSTAPIVPYQGGWLWFHCLGDIYGRALLDLLRYTLPAEATVQIGLGLLFRDEPRAIPTLTPEQVKRYLQERYRSYESMLALGAYHHLLPPELRMRTVVEQFNVPRFLRAVQSLRIERAPEALAEDLSRIIFA